MSDDHAAGALARLHDLALALGRLRALDDMLQAIVCAAAGSAGKGVLSLYRVPDGGLEVVVSCGIEAARAADLQALHTTTIRGRGGKVLGVLSVHLERPRSPTPVEVQLFETCAQFAAGAVEVARLRDALAVAPVSDERLARLLDLA